MELEQIWKVHDGGNLERKVLLKDCRHTLRSLLTVGANAVQQLAMHGWSWCPQQGRRTLTAVWAWKLLKNLAKKFDSSLTIDIKWYPLSASKRFDQK